MEAFLDEMASRYEKLPNRLRAIAKFIEANRARMVAMRITAVASGSGVRPSAVTRFAQRFGLSGYSELQRLFREAFDASSSPAAAYAKKIRSLQDSSQGPASAWDILRQTLLANQGAMEELALRVDHRILEAATTVLRRSEQVYVVGLGRSYPAAAFLADLLQHTSKRVQLVNGAGGDFAGQVRSIRSGDVLVAISSSPYARETCECARLSRGRGAKVIAITDSTMAPVARAASLQLVVQESGTFALRSLTNTMCVCQALFLAMAAGDGQADGRCRLAEVPPSDPEGIA